jgi:cytochrome P450
VPSRLGAYQTGTREAANERGQGGVEMATLRDVSNSAFNPFFAEEIAFGTVVDPWPAIAEQRHRAPVSEGAFGDIFGVAPDQATADRRKFTAWTYDTVREVLGTPEVFSSAIVHKFAVEKAFGRILLTMDPPGHSRYRRFLQGAFSPRAIKAWAETLIRPLMHELIDEFIADGSADLVSQFTRRFPFEIVFRLLNLPPGDIALFHKLAVTQTFVTTLYAEEAREAGERLAEYFQALLDERRQSPGEDLLSQLAFTEMDGEYLEDEILVAFMRHILNASADTSYRTTGCLLVALLNEPELLGSLRNDPAKVAPAIEEALRWEGPVMTNFRTVARDHTMAGVHMPAGSVIHVAQGSANHDETYFEDPERFNPARPNASRHMGFGSGPHVCVGMHLARLQIREAVAVLLERLPDLRLDPAYPAPVIRGFLFRHPPELRVTF